MLDIRQNSEIRPKSAAYTLRELSNQCMSKVREQGGKMGG